MQVSSIPLYEKTRQGISNLIREQFSAGDLLPTQERLAMDFGASLITVKRALNELAREQVVESIRGRGTVVKGANVTDTRHGVSSWTDSVLGLGERPQTGWITLKREIPESRIRHLLSLKAREQVVRVERLRLVEDSPICLMNNYLPSKLVPGLEDMGLSRESLYQCLRERFGLNFKTARETVSARLSTAQERKHLGDEVAVVLEIERVTEDAHGQAVEWAHVIANAERYTYQMKLTNF